MKNFPPNEKNSLFFSREEKTIRLPSVIRFAGDEATFLPSCYSLPMECNYRLLPFFPHLFFFPPLLYQRIKLPICIFFSCHLRICFFLLFFFRMEFVESEGVIGSHTRGGRKWILRFLNIVNDLNKAEGFFLALRSSITWEKRTLNAAVTERIKQLIDDQTVTKRNKSLLFLLGSKRRHMRLNLMCNSARAIFLFSA